MIICISHRPRKGESVSVMVPCLMTSEYMHRDFAISRKRKLLRGHLGTSK